MTALFQLAHHERVCVFQRAAASCCGSGAYLLYLPLEDDLVKLYKPYSANQHQEKHRQQK